MKAETLVIAGKISDELDFNFSTRIKENPNKIVLLTHHVKVPDGGDPLRGQQELLNRDYFIHLTREEMKKLRDALDVVLNFTPEESSHD